MREIMFDPIRLVLLDELRTSPLRHAELMSTLICYQLTESLVFDAIGVDEEIGQSS